MDWRDSLLMRRSVVASGQEYLKCVFTNELLPAKRVGGRFSVPGGLLIKVGTTADSPISAEAIRRGGVSKNLHASSGSDLATCTG